MRHGRSQRPGFTAKVVLPAGVCLGFVPFFDTPTTGTCVPSITP